MSRIPRISIGEPCTFLLEKPDAELVRLECTGSAAAALDCTLSLFAKGGGT